MNYKRSQVTAFIILGLVLFVFIFIFLLIEDKGKDSDVISSQKANTEIIPIKRYVESCLYEVTKEGIIKAGLHGGYTEITPQQLNINPASPTQSEAFEFLKGTGIYIPYWTYVDSDNSCRYCTKGSKRPPLRSASLSQDDMSIESNIRRYVDRELENCLKSFSSFEPEFKIIQNAPPRSIISIRDEDVTAKLILPLSINKGNKVFEIERFVSDPLDVKLKDMYRIAKKITDFEEEYTFFEKNTLNTISAGSMPGPDMNKLPPPTGTDFKCGPSSRWFKEDVRIKLRNLLIRTISKIQVFGQQEFKALGEGRFSKGFYTQYYMTLNLSRKIPYKISFDYLDWTPYIDIYPSKGNILEGTPLTFSLVIYNFCMHMYEFSYDISYPITATIEDDNAFKGEGFSLNFGIEVNIRQNEPINSTYNQQIMTNYSNYMPSSTLCSPEQEASGTYTINVTEPYTGNPIKGVIVNFCVPDNDGYCREDTCMKGTTDKKGNLDFRIPHALGIITFSKEGYHKEYRGIYFSEDNTTLKIKMHKEIEKEVFVKKKLITAEISDFSKRWYFKKDKEYDLLPEERATLTFIRMNEGEEPYSAVTVIRGNETKKIKLIPGEYKVESTLMAERNLIIPEEEICESFGIWPFTYKECETIPETKMDSIPLGGISINEENRYFEIKEEDLNNDNKLKVIDVAIDDSKLNKHDELKYFSKYIKISNSYRNDVEPEFVSG